MRKTRSIWIALGSLGLLVSYAGAVELKSWDFETEGGVADAPLDWNFSDPELVVTFWSATEAHSGTHSVAMAFPEVNDMWRVDDFSVTPGTNVHVSAWIKYVGLDAPTPGVSPAVLIRFFSEPGALAGFLGQEFAWIYGTGDLGGIEFTIDMQVPEQGLYADVILWMFGGFVEAIYMDDVVVSDDTEPAAVADWSLYE